MGIGNGGDSHVMVVAATENEAALVACNQIADFIRAARRFD
jgi:hypothetical protein